MLYTGLTAGARAASAIVKLLANNSNSATSFER